MQHWGKMKAIAIIVAAGKGLRMQNAVSKQYLKLGGRPIIAHTLSAFEACRMVEHIYLVIPKQDLEFCRQEILPSIEMQSAVTLVAGGAERQASVYNGLLAVSPKTGMVAIHDGVRPLVTPEMITACIEGARETGACILGIPASDTLKQANAEGIIETTLPRHDIWLAQTPQVFSYDLILKAHETALQAGISGTDDAALMERIGHPVRIIRGSSSNIKITTPEDLRRAEAIQAISMRTAWRPIP